MVCRVPSGFVLVAQLRRFTANPSSGAKERALDGPEPSQYMCPVTLQELNGSHSFVVLKTSGWILSEKAIKEVGIDSLQVGPVP